MPKIFTHRGFDFVIYFGDHKPSHVHIFGHGCEAKIEIDSLKIIKNKGLKQREMKIICDFIKKNMTSFKEAWEEYNE